MGRGCRGLVETGPKVEETEEVLETVLREEFLNTEDRIRSGQSV
jgi:hypothetical protein